MLGFLSMQRNSRRKAFRRSLGTEPCTIHGGAGLGPRMVIVRTWALSDGSFAASISRTVLSIAAASIVRSRSIEVSFGANRIRQRGRRNRFHCLGSRDDTGRCCNRNGTLVRCTPMFCPTDLQKNESCCRRAQQHQSSKQAPHRNVDAL